MNELIRSSIKRNLNDFTKIYNENGDKVNPIPEETSVTVYFVASSGNYFIDNTTSDLLGILHQDAYSWILDDCFPNLFE